MNPTSTPSNRIVIVGASLAGATAAAELREQGTDAEIVLIGEESHRPYERPPLTKQLLRGETEPVEAEVHPADLYEQSRIDLRTGTRATRIDRDARRVELADGSDVTYDKLLLATGARPRTIAVPGSHLDGVLVLRTIDDSIALRERVAGGARLAVVGAGWIGCEAAASARQLGAEVTLIEAGASPLERVLGTRMGSMFADLHREHGVDVRTGAGVSGFTGEDKVTGVELSDGTTIPCDVALVGVGVAPAQELAGQAGLSVSNGIEVDALLRTSDPDVFAAGDVALADHPRYGPLRVEHWENARRQGAHVAASMLGSREPFAEIPYFFSDQYDLGMEYSGLARPDDELVIRGDVDARELIAFWLRDGRVVAGMNVNVWDVTDDIRALIASGSEVDRARLADPDAALAEVAA